MASFRKRGAVWYFRFVDADGVKREVKGCPDRRATKEMANEAESEAAKIRSGVIERDTKTQVKVGRLPVGDLLNEFHAHLIAKGNTAKHADLFVDRARRVVALVKGGSLADIDPPRTASAADRSRASALAGKLLANARISDLSSTDVQAALATLRDGGRSLATCNHHRAAIRGFTSWLIKDKKLRADSLAGVVGFNAKEDRRHDRRTISLEELRRVVEAAQVGANYREMSGPARALCYRLAVSTGLRFSEIASITPGSFDWSADSATVTVAAGYTKNGDPATLHLPADVAADLRRWVAALPAGSPIFLLPSRGADMLKVDLDAAGVPYRDAAGLVFDFHALRCQCATLADEAGGSPRLVQQMMRHSDLKLTGRYTRHRNAEIERVAHQLPSLGRGTPLPELAPIGTDVQPISERFAHYLPTVGDVTSCVTIRQVEMSETERLGPTSHNLLGLTGIDASRRDLTGTVVNSGGGTRTPDTRIMIPLL
ncbi:Site-specific recombinase XerD [Singulisphaera sp. GP187]|nr:Site-specific recombinase XerD [Singulisphaera sp. GP187]